MTKKISKTDRILQKMFTENTGVHMCDSGGSNGRMWQRNQGRKMAKDPVATVEFDISTWKDEPELSVDYTRSAFHFLASRLTYEAGLTRSLHMFNKRPENQDDYWLSVVEKWIEWKFKGEARGLYGDGDPIVENTYNHECNLSQTLQYTFFTVNGEGYYALQIHGGADVRGGYTAPRIFSEGRYGEFELARVADGDIVCSEKDCTAGWYTDDSYHWYENGNGEDIEDLKKYPVVKCETEEPGVPGTIKVFNGKATCPCCGKGFLVA